MSDAKSYLYSYICRPTLMYELDAINLSAPTQGSIIKRVCSINSETLTPHAVTACPY